MILAATMLSYGASAAGAAALRPQKGKKAAKEIKNPAQTELGRRNLQQQKLVTLNQSKRFTSSSAPQ